MILHVGNKKYINTCDIIAIIDLSNPEFKGTFGDLESSNSGWRSCILTTEGRYYTNISVSALAKRSINPLFTGKFGG